MNRFPLVALSGGLLLIGAVEKDPTITFPEAIPPAVANASESTVKLGIFNETGFEYTDPNTGSTEHIAFDSDLLSVGSGVKLSDDIVLTAGHVIAGSNKSPTSEDIIQTECGDVLVWGQHEDDFFASHSDPTGIYTEYTGTGLRDFGLLKVGVDEDALVKTFTEIPDATIGGPPAPYQTVYISSYQDTPEGEDRGPGAELRGSGPNLKYPTILGAYILADITDKDHGEIVLLATDPEATLEGADPTIRNGASGSPVLSNEGYLIGIVSGVRNGTNIKEIESKFEISTPYPEDTRINLVVAQLLGDSVVIGSEIANSSGCEKSEMTIYQK